MVLLQDFVTRIIQRRLKFNIMNHILTLRCQGFNNERQNRRGANTATGGNKEADSMDHINFILLDLTIVQDGLYPNSPTNSSSNSPSSSNNNYFNAL